MSDRIQVIEENVRKYINHVFVDYLSLPDRELKVLLTLKSFAWYDKEDCHPSLGKIAKICKKSKSQVREILRILEAKGLVRTEQDIGDVSNYYITNKFVEPEKLSTDKVTPPEIRRTHPTGNPVPTPPEIRCLNNNKGNKTKILNISCPHAQNFDRFWNAYPRKQKKRDAIKAWEGLKGIEIETILTDIQNRLGKDVQWQDKQYIPYPASYLRGQRWNDEIVTPQPIKPKPKPEEPRSTVPWYNPADAMISGTNRNSQGVIADAERQDSGRDHIRRGDLFEDQKASLPRSTLADDSQAGSTRSNGVKTAGAYFLSKRDNR